MGKMMFVLIWCCLGVMAQEEPDKKDMPKLLASVDMKFWGRAFFDVHYDTDDIRGNTDFATYVTSEGGEELNFNPRDTRFGFSASSKKKGRWKTGMVFEMDFYGTNSGNNIVPRLRLGYAKLSNDSGFSMRAGQDWIPIGQQNPAMVEFGIMAWGGNLWWRVPQVTLRKKSGSIEWLGSLMKHRISSSQESQEEMPWAIGRVSWSQDKNLVALGLAARSVEVDGVDYDPYLAVLEYKAALGSRALVKGEVWTGAGVGREFIRYGLDYNPEQGDTISGSGGFVSFSINGLSGQSFNFGYGLDQPSKDDTYAPGTQSPISSVPFLKNQILFANVKWKLNKQFGWAFEVMDFDTEQKSGSSIRANRFTVGVWYVF